MSGHSGMLKEGRYEEWVTVTRGGFESGPPRPGVGDEVHYLLTDGLCAPAVVVSINHWWVDLEVRGPGGEKGFFPGVPHDDSGGQRERNVGTWHWPEL